MTGFKAGAGSGCEVDIRDLVNPKWAAVWTSWLSNRVLCDKEPLMPPHLIGRQQAEVEHKQSRIGDVEHVRRPGPERAGPRTRCTVPGLMP